jgi:RHS repeat-associated protein
MGYSLSSNVEFYSPLVEKHTRNPQTCTRTVEWGLRYYNPELERWISRDPIGEAGGINLYGCVGNDPIIGIAPLGLEQRWQQVEVPYQELVGYVGGRDRGDSRVFLTRYWTEYRMVEYSPEPMLEESCFPCWQWLHWWRLVCQRALQPMKGGM